MTKKQDASQCYIQRAERVQHARMQFLAMHCLVPTRSRCVAAAKQQRFVIATTLLRRASVSYCTRTVRRGYGDDTGGAISGCCGWPPVPVQREGDAQCVSVQQVHSFVNDFFSTCSFSFLFPCCCRRVRFVPAFFLCSLCRKLRLGRVLQRVGRPWPQPLRR